MSERNLYKLIGNWASRGVEATFVTSSAASRLDGVNPQPIAYVEIATKALTLLAFGMAPWAVILWYIGVI